VDFEEVAVHNKESKKPCFNNTNGNWTQSFNVTLTVTDKMDVKKITKVTVQNQIP
jgi:hypothetical protein